MPRTQTEFEAYREGALGVVDALEISIKAMVELFSVNAFPADVMLLLLNDAKAMVNAAVDQGIVEDT